MLYIICSFLIVFFFEGRWLYKNKGKKEAAAYIVFFTIAFFFGLFLILVPDYTDFSKTMLDLFNIK